MHGRVGIGCLILGAALLGCGGSDVPCKTCKDYVKAPPPSGFIAAKTSTIEGWVLWDGDVPAARETIVRANAYNPFLYKNPATFTTPHIPRVHKDVNGIGGAVVFLRGVDPNKAKPWDHPKARVVFHERELRIEQGDERTNVGFVQRGDAIEIVNRGPEYHRLVARGADFFSIPLIQRDSKHERVLKDSGIVDLTCGVGYYWLHAHLFVVDHPYYTLTRPDGSFRFEQVPPGEYDLVSWIPSWHVERIERDPETATIARQAWRAPLELVQKISIREDNSDGRTSIAIPFMWTRADFD